MRFVIIRIILLVSILLNLQFITISAHNLINANTQDKAIFEWCIRNTE